MSTVATARVYGAGCSARRSRADRRAEARHTASQPSMTASPRGLRAPLTAGRHQFLSVFASALGVAVSEATVDLEIDALCPARLPQPLDESLIAGAPFRIAFGEIGQQPNSANALRRLLRPRRQRPRGRAAEQRHD